MDTALTVAGALAIAGVHGLRVWLRARTRTTRLRQRALTERLAALPPGSIWSEHHTPGRTRVTAATGPLPARDGDTRHG